MQALLERCIERDGARTSIGPCARDAARVFAAVAFFRPRSKAHSNAGVLKCFRVYHIQERQRSPGMLSMGPE
jgi:hypothetical protein